MPEHDARTSPSSPDGVAKSRAAVLVEPEAKPSPRPRDVSASPTKSFMPIRNHDSQRLRGFAFAHAQGRRRSRTALMGVSPQPKRPKSGPDASRRGSASRDVPFMGTSQAG